MDFSVHVIRVGHPWYDSEVEEILQVLTKTGYDNPSDKAHWRRR